MFFDKNVGSALADHDQKPVRQGGPYIRGVERRSVSVMGLSLSCHFVSFVCQFYVGFMSLCVGFFASSNS